MTIEEYTRLRIIFIGMIKQNIKYAYRNIYDLEDIIHYCFEDYIKAKRKKIDDNQIFKILKLKLYTYVRDNLYRYKAKINRVNKESDIALEYQSRNNENFKKIENKLTILDIIKLCTKRQKKILLKTYEGYSQEEIGKILGVSRVTVYTEFKNIKRKVINLP